MLLYHFADGSKSRYFGLEYVIAPVVQFAFEQTKVSGQFRNAAGKGADRYAKIRSVIDTTLKNGQDVYVALLCMANCRVSVGE
jgi:hypothetical protein